MDYICRHCNSNLDEGDIFEYFLSKYDDHIKALQTGQKTKRNILIEQLSFSLNQENNIPNALIAKKKIHIIKILP